MGRHLAGLGLAAVAAGLLACPAARPAPATAVAAPVEAPAEPAALDARDLPRPGPLTVVEDLRAAAPGRDGSLDEAWALYRRGDFDGAAAAAGAGLEPGAGIPEGEEAAALLAARALLRGGLPTSALALLAELAERDEPDLEVFVWLAAAASRLAGSTEAEAAICRLDPARIDEAAAGQDAALRDLLRYLRGRCAVTEGELGLAEELLAAVPATSGWHGDARLLLSTVYLRDGQQWGPALAAVHDVLRALERGGPLGDADLERRRVTAWLAAGRINFSVAGQDEGTLRRALAAFGRVPASSPERDEAAFEEAWVLERLGEPEAALERLGTLGPSFLEARPEALLLRAVLAFERSDYPLARRVVGDLREADGRLLAELQMVLRVVSEPAALLETARAIAEGSRTASPELRAAMARALARGPVRSALARLDQIAEERSGLGQRSPAFRSSPVGERVLEDLELARSLETDRAGELARAALESEIRERLEARERAETIDREAEAALVHP